MIVVTTDAVPGYRVVAVLGEVLGLTVRSLNVATSLTAGLRSLAGGEIPEHTRVLEESRAEATARMTSQAAARGANAVIGTRFDTGAVGQFGEVCAYGTAAVVEPLPAGVPGSTPQSAQDADRAAAGPPGTVPPGTTPPDAASLPGH
ncbi:YbjQ family protein [Cellulomonas endophytica]|uniref:YbjQ family protein n=1 Tax=Cellulomonas endophytica TaxID=2494735 RepID=UPI0010111C95|nr:YbjQ family protein [Cellulomonas endophytica]